MILIVIIKYKDFIDIKLFDVILKLFVFVEYSFEGDLSVLNGVYVVGKLMGGFINNIGGSVSYVDGVIG